ncbi:MAG: LysR family transcriptional regulator [Deltaproteobacteria bacterium]|nr:LysR family transcriptional regulator [Deltaproteobacteria bacterium]
MEWGDVRYFLAVARAGRLAVAARGLGVEHTTVGRRIAALEQALGTPLFHRTAAGWRLTRVGEQIVPRAEAMEAEARSLLATSYSAAASAAGRIRIATIESWGCGWLIPKLGVLRARHPELEIDVHTGQAQLNLTRGEADVAFRVPKPKQPDLSAMAVAEGSVGLFARPEVAAQHRRAVEAGRGKGVPIALYTPELDFLQSAPWFRSLVADADVRVRMSSTMGLIALALAEPVVVPVPRFVLGDAELVPCGSGDLARHRLWCVAHRDVRRDPRVAAVFGWARDTLAPVVHASERLR